MMRHLSAHGFDPGPSERPLLAGAVTGLIAAIPGGAVLVAFGTFKVVADVIFRLSAPLTAAILIISFLIAGALYGSLFRRAANDHDGCWLFGLAFGFLLWIAAPVVVLPLLQQSAIAAGTAGIGFLASFLTWGLVLGVLLPFVHRPLRANLEGRTRGLLARLGPEAASSGKLSRTRGFTESSSRRRSNTP